MLKRKKDAGSQREPTRIEYANVIPIVDSRYASREESDRALASLEGKTKKRVERAVDRFLSSPGIEDLGQFNDLVLRAYLKLPARIRETQQGRTFFEKICKAANSIMAQRKRTIDRVNENPYVVSLLDASVEEMGRNLLTLESSVMQLARFVSYQAQSNPKRVFATGVNIDVRYGIDLVGADVDFDQEENQLTVNLILWQAKASRVGASANEVRGLSQRYRGQRNAVVEELEFDAGWVQAHLLDRRPEPNLELDDETVFEIVAGEIEQLSAIHQKLDSFSAQDRFLAELRIYRLLEAAAAEFGGKIPEGFTRPRIAVGTVDFRYLVDTITGTQDLNEDDVGSFGLAAK
jgi:hypothetical protein